MITLNRKFDQFTKCYDSGPDPIGPVEAAGIQGRMVRRQLPRILNIIQGEMPDMAQAQYDASAQVSPQYASLALALQDAFGTQMSDANARVAERNVSNLADIVGGSGADLVRSATETAAIADPEYYRTRELLGSGLERLISGQDPNQLTEAELENVTRGVNRTNIGTGQANTGSQTATLSNALTFGDELKKKRDQFGQALGLATGSLPAMRSGVDTFRMVTGQPGTAGLGDTRFSSPTQTGEGENAYGLAGNILGVGQGNVGSFNENQDMRGGFERVVGSLPDY